MREIASPLSGPFTTFGQTPIDIYKVGAYRPELAYSFYNDYYRRGRQPVNFLDAITHTRNGNATMTDSSGNIVWAPHNLLTYSEQFDNAAWVISPLGTGSVTKSTADAAIAPDGTLTADRVIFDLAGGTTTGDIALLRQANATTGSLTHSVYLRSSDGLSSYTMQIVQPDGNALNITVTGSWQRFEVSGTSSGSVNYGVRLRGGQSPANSDYADVLMWGAHLYRSDLGGMVNNPDSGDSYVPTTSSARHLPRRGHHVYNGSEWVNEGLLHESEARTNLITYSEDFTDASWAKTRSLIALDAVGPDGQANSAATLSDDSSTGNNDVRLQVNCTVSTTTDYTFSIFAKADQLSWMALRTTDFTTPSNQYSYFDLSSGTLGTIGADHTATIEDVGNNWYRCSITFTTDASDTTGAVQIFLADADGDPNVDLDGTSSILIYGAQFEAGSTPSSYIPTTSGATATRAAETLTIPYENLTWPEPEYISGELVTNGGFDTDSDWTKGTGITITGGEAVFTAVATGQNLRQPITLPAGVYLISYDVAEYTTGGVAVFGPAYSPDIQRTAVGSYSEVAYFPGSGNLDIRARGTTTLKVDNISVREINPLALSFQMEGLVTYADDGLSEQASFIRWRVSASDYINIKLDTSSTDIGQIYFQQLASGVNDPVLSASDTYSPDILVPFNISSRHGSTFINGAVDGVALTANTTPVALPDLSTTDLSLGYNFMGTISLLRIWSDDIGDVGISEASA